MSIQILYVIAQRKNDNPTNIKVINIEMACFQYFFLLIITTKTPKKMAGMLVTTRIIEKTVINLFMGYLFLVGNETSLF